MASMATPIQPWLRGHAVRLAQLQARMAGGQFLHWPMPTETGPGCAHHWRAIGLDRRRSGPWYRATNTEPQALPRQTLAAPFALHRAGNTAAPLQSTKNRLRCGPFRQAQTLPPARLLWNLLCQPAAGAFGQARAFAQGHHFSEIRIQPRVLAIVQPLKIIRQPAAQVDAQALGCLAKKAWAHFPNQARAPTAHSAR